MRISSGTPQVFLPKPFYLRPPTADFLWPLSDMDLRTNKKQSLKLGPEEPSIKDWGKLIEG